MRLYSNPQRHRASSTTTRLVAIVVIGVFIALGLAALLRSHAATVSLSLEAENGVVSNGAQSLSDSKASGGSYVSFSAGLPWSPAGTYTDWQFPDNSIGYDSLEWTFTPQHDPDASLMADGLLHYYAYNFKVINATDTLGPGYAGFQTNGVWLGQSKGKAINFSIWGSNEGDSTNPATLINPKNTESGGWQLMLPFSWIQGHQYAFQLKQGVNPTDAQGKWWGLWVTDNTTQQTTYVGEQRIPTTINGKAADKLDPHTYMFGEDTHWWRTYQTSPVLYSSCSAFQNSSLSATSITANSGMIHPISFVSHTNSGQTLKNPNGYSFETCPVSVYTNTAGDVQHNLGYWSPPAPREIP